MRAISVITLLLLSGCTSAPIDDGSLEWSGPEDEVMAPEESGAASSEPAPAADETKATQNESSSPPAPMHRESGFTIGIDPRSANGNPCQGPALINCDRPTFRMDEAYDIHATLAWSSPGSDLDLYLYRADEQVSADGVNSDLDLLSTSQELHFEDLPAGEYAMWVTVRHGVVGTYTLDVVFTTPS